MHEGAGPRNYHNNNACLDLESMYQHAVIFRYLPHDLTLPSPPPPSLAMIGDHSSSDRHEIAAVDFSDRVE